MYGAQIMNQIEAAIRDGEDLQVALWLEGVKENRTYMLSYVLALAMEHRQREIAKLAAELGADLNIRMVVNKPSGMKQHDLPIDLAIERGDTDLVEYFLGYGAKIPKTVPNTFGLTPLVYVQKMGCTELEALLRRLEEV